MVDVRGIRRGKCRQCSCDGFTNEGTVHCAKCHHSPVKHFNLDKDSGATTTALRSPLVQDVDVEQEVSTMCALHPRCTNSAYFDANTGESSYYCEEHRDRPDSMVIDIYGMVHVQFISMLVLLCSHGKIVIRLTRLTSSKCSHKGMH